MGLICMDSNTFSLHISRSTKNNCIICRMSRLNDLNNIRLKALHTCVFIQAKQNKK